MPVWLTGKALATIGVVVVIAAVETGMWYARNKDSLRKKVKGYFPRPAGGIDT